MKKGSNVKVIDRNSAFRGQEGKIEQIRTGPLPLGVRLKPLRGKVGVLLWCHEDELEWLP